MTELTGLTVAEPVGVESDRTNWTNSGRASVSGSGPVCGLRRTE